MDWISLIVPFAYLGILVTSLATFSSLYRKRKTKKFLSLAPYFPTHTPRNVYLSLLHLQDHDPSAPKVPESVLRAALLARCTENIHRIIHIRTRKQALGTLLKRGSVGDEIWERLIRSEKELEAEVKDCVVEANAYSATWGATIFQSANEMANNDMLKKRLESITSSLPSEKAAWEAKLESTRRGFMEELDSGGNARATGGKATSALPFPSPSATSTQHPTGLPATTPAGSGTNKPYTTSSDDDAVMVEKGGGTTALDADSRLEAAAGSGEGTGTGTGGGKPKKRKGKK